MGNIEIDRWIDGYKVRAFKWIDNKSIYINVQYFKSGSSIESPVWDKTAYITINNNGINVVSNYLSSLVNYISGLKIEKEQKIILTF